MTHASMPRSPDPVDLPAEVEAFTREQLGLASLRHLGRPEVAASLSARMARGQDMQDAVLGELHAELHGGPNGGPEGDRGVANEFLAFFFYELHKLGKFSMSSSSRLRRFLDTGDLVDSVIGDLWPEIPALEFESRNQFLNLFSQRLGWKAADKGRRLNSGNRREDRRLFVEPEDLDHGSAELEASEQLIRAEERERLALVLMRLKPRDQKLLRLRIKGLDIQQIADELDLRYDTARKAIARALEQARALIDDDRRRPPEN